MFQSFILILIKICTTLVYTLRVIHRYGAGSEYRREEKEEARKKRLGYAARNYNPDDQPWILKCGGKNGKK